MSTGTTRLSSIEKELNLELAVYIDEVILEWYKNEKNGKFTFATKYASDEDVWTDYRQEILEGIKTIVERHKLKRIVISVFFHQDDSAEGYSLCMKVADAQLHIEAGLFPGMESKIQAVKTL